MSENGVVESTYEKKSSSNVFDFNLEETDWTFNDMEESPMSRLLLNKSVENKGKVEWNKIPQIFQTENSLSENKSEEEVLSNENTLNLIGSLNIKDSFASQCTLKPIPEVPSYEEISVYEDSSNLIPNLSLELDIDQNQRRNSFESKGKKTLTDIKEKFKCI